MGAKLVRSKLDQYDWQDPELKKFLRPVKDEAERSALLTQKLFEEVGEFVASLTSGDKFDSVDEAGDVVDVLRALVFERGASPDLIESKRVNKGATLGDFMSSNLVWEM